LDPKPVRPHFGRFFSQTHLLVTLITTRKNDSGAETIRGRVRAKGWQKFNEVIPPRRLTPDFLDCQNQPGGYNHRQRLQEMMIHGKVENNREVFEAE
jgi:hypothetical protein